MCNLQCLPPPPIYSRPWKLEDVHIWAVLGRNREAFRQTALHRQSHVCNCLVSHYLQLIQALVKRRYLNNYVLFFGSRSQCISQMKELKEQCEERIEEITRKGNEIPQSKEKTMSDKHYQVS